MSIFRLTRQSNISLSEDWKLFLRLFHNIGSFTYKESVQTAYFDDNAQRIFGTAKSMPRDSYRELMQRLTAEPVDGEQDLYLIRVGAEKRFFKIHRSQRSEDEIGFVEEITRRVGQQAADYRHQDFDDVTSMLRFPAFSAIVQRRFQKSKRVSIAALHIEGLDKITDFSNANSTNYCMASVAEVLGRFAGEQVIFATKSFQNFYVCFVDMEDANVMMLLEQMCSAIAECTISDDFGQPVHSAARSSLKLHAGLAVHPEAGSTLSRLIPYAEFALFETQHHQKNPVTRFSMEAYERKKDEYREEQLFNTIMSENQLTYHFQPIVDAHTGNIVAYEALMRNEHFTPDKLLSLAQKYNRLYDVEYATMFNCMKFLSEHQNVFSNKKLFINCIASAPLNDHDYNALMLTYEGLFEKTVLEIIEQSVAGEEDLLIVKKRCAALGGQIAIDDYGTGYANTATLLRNLPAYVKIDRCLIDGICRDVKKQQLVSGIIDYAHDNQIQVLAEGIEEEEDLRTVIRLGVDLVQGYYTSRPKPYLLEEVAAEVRDVIINTNLENSSGHKKIYNAHNDEVLDLVDLALQNYTDIHVFRHNMTIIGDPEKTVPIHIAIMENHSCELTLRNVNLISKEKPCIAIGSYAQLTMHVEGKNSLNYMGIRVPQGSFFDLKGSGDLKIDCYSKIGYGIGGDCDSSYGCITLESTGRLEIICNSDRSVGIGGGKNPDDSEIHLKTGDIRVEVASPNGVGIGCMDGFSLIYTSDSCQLELEMGGISSVGMGSLSGETSIECKTDLNFTGGGSRVVGIGVLNQGGGEVYVENCRQRYHMRTNFGTCIGGIGGKVDVYVKNCKIEVNAEGGEITGIGDAKGSGNVALEGTQLNAYILAAKPHEAGSKNGQFSMRGSTIIADINDQHNTQEV
ncbi:MAG: EAL domain-containing protein [Oscillospiraceae bacterium]|nr:EAL domain-containing protein [Oscillospiraceae bacterium]